jgi:D-alanyl-D-alanine carboxypeptidase/D-alanyl-D-alanine-endopeptidase (penicillin-binding protein 4)
MRAFLILALVCVPAKAQSAPARAARPALKTRIDRALSIPPALRTHWGIRIVDLSTGQILYDRNADRYFIPASTTKLFSSALALSRLGPGYRFVTTITADQRPDARGILHGDLRLVGGGDPTLSARVYPYDKDAKPGDPLVAMDELARQLGDAGVRRIEGDIIGDDTAYVHTPYPQGWTVDDSLYDYGAPVSALVFNDNTVSLAIRPGDRVGDPALLSLSPPSPEFLLDNRVRTGERGQRRISLERAPGSTHVRLWGTIPLRDPDYTERLAVPDAAYNAAAALRDALSRQAVVVNGGIAVAHRLPSDAGPVWSEPRRGVELARRASPPLVEILKVVNKVSQNLHAEIALREVARAVRGSGDLDAGLDEMRAFLQAAGIADKEYSFEDASGLSRRTLVTPAAVAQLLRHMHGSPHREHWLSLLPSGGEDGSLERRFPRSPGRVRAKTGSLAHTTALSGYVRRSKGGAVAFCVVANNDNAPAAETRRVIDTIVTYLLD